MDIPYILQYALTLSVTFKYLLVFIGTVVEGPVLMVAAGFLIHLGVFDPIPLYITILSADLVGDIAWYYVGYYFAEPWMKKHGHFLSLTPETFEKIKKLFHKYHDRILFFSKLTIGFGFALGTLIVAGATHVPFRKYMLINLLGEVLLVIILLGIGYFFAEIFKYVDDSLKVGFAVCVMTAMALGIYGFTRYMKKRAANL